MTEDATGKTVLWPEWCGSSPLAGLVAGPFPPHVLSVGVTADKKRWENPCMLPGGIFPKRIKCLKYFMDLLAMAAAGWKVRGRLVSTWCPASTHCNAGRSYPRRAVSSAFAQQQNESSFLVKMRPFPLKSALALQLVMWLRAFSDVSKEELKR